jgi:hypothetical protein
VEGSRSSRVLFFKTREKSEIMGVHNACLSTGYEKNSLTTQMENRLGR